MFNKVIAVQLNSKKNDTVPAAFEYKGDPLFQDKMGMPVIDPGSRIGVVGDISFARKAHLGGDILLVNAIPYDNGRIVHVQFDKTLTASGTYALVGMPEKSRVIRVGDFIEDWFLDMNSTKKKNGGNGLIIQKVQSMAAAFVRNELRENIDVFVVEPNQMIGAGYKDMLVQLGFHAVTFFRTVEECARYYRKAASVKILAGFVNVSLEDNLSFWEDMDRVLKMFSGKRYGRLWLLHSYNDDTLNEYGVYRQLFDRPYEERQYIDSFYHKTDVSLDWFDMQVKKFTDDIVADYSSHVMNGSF